MRHKYGPVLFPENVGMDDRSTELFKGLVSTFEHSSQVMYPVATLGIILVWFVVSTGRSITQGPILYGCHIEFAQYLRHGYKFAMDCVRVSSFDWIGGDGKQMPPEYADLLPSSHASDLYTFVSYCHLSPLLRMVDDVFEPRTDFLQFDQSSKLQGRILFIQTAFLFRLYVYVFHYTECNTTGVAVFVWTTRNTEHFM